MEDPPLRGSRAEDTGEALAQMGPQILKSMSLRLPEPLEQRWLSWHCTLEHHSRQGRAQGQSPLEFPAPEPCPCSRTHSKGLRDKPGVTASSCSPPTPQGHTAPTCQDEL